MFLLHSSQNCLVVDVLESDAACLMDLRGGNLVERDGDLCYECRTSWSPKTMISNMNPWNWRWCSSRAFRAPVGPPGVGVETMVSIPINITDARDTVYTIHFGSINIRWSMITTEMNQLISWVAGDCHDRSIPTVPSMLTRRPPSSSYPTQSQSEAVF